MQNAKPEKQPENSEGNEQGLAIQQKPLPPGVFRVDRQGNVRPAVDWQKIIDRIPWENADQFLDKILHRSSGITRLQLAGKFGVAGIAVIAASVLAYVGIIEGQTIATLYGAVIGYMFTKAFRDEW